MHPFVFVLPQSGSHFQYDISPDHRVREIRGTVFASFPNSRAIGGVGYFSGMRDLVWGIHHDSRPEQWGFGRRNPDQRFETGHAVADSLGGSPYMPENFWAQSQFCNRGRGSPWRKQEVLALRVGRISECFDAVHIKITFEYDKQEHTTPARGTYKVQLDGLRSLACYNALPPVYKNAFTDNSAIRSVTERWVNTIP